MKDQIPLPRAIKTMVNSWEAAQVISEYLTTDQHKVRAVSETTARKKPEIRSYSKSPNRYDSPLVCWVCGGNHLKKLCPEDPETLTCKHASIKATQQQHMKQNLPTLIKSLTRKRHQVTKKPY